MKVTFILPAIGKKKGRKYIGTWQKMEPLVFGALSALLPPDVERELFDDRIELIDYDKPTDLVCISVEIYTARRAYLIAEKFRQRGVKVVLGGYHTTLCPEEAMEHGDSIVVGNAESCFPKLIEDFKQGKLLPRYDGVSGNFGEIVADRKIFAGKKYAQIAVIETGRGCNFDCEFCAITAFHHARYHRRSVESIVTEINEAKASGKFFFFFADDNIVADQQYAIELFKAIAPLKIRWTGQGSLTMAKNEELLYWMKKSGCMVILIGFESLEFSNLQQMNKQWNASMGETDLLVQKIHSFGLNIYATFVFGFDHDSRELFHRTVEFSKKHAFYFTAFNHLLPMPGTKLYKRLLEEKRVIKDKWWLDPNYLYGELTFMPKALSPEETSKLCVESRDAFYRIPAIFNRFLKLLTRKPDFFTVLYFWIINLHLGNEVHEKDGLPLGENLDELPK